jgi:ABC-type amino acid transport system permease subunit
MTYKFDFGPIFEAWPQLLYGAWQTLLFSILAMAFGIAFHLGTAVFIGIPQMGLAFIACYAVWLDEDVAERLWARLPDFTSPRRALVT